MKNRMIYLLGGNAKRFPSNKLLYKLNGKELYRYTLEVLLKLVDICGYELYLVTQHKEIAEQIQDSRITIIYDTSCKYGVSYSIKAALKALKKEEAYNTFIVADTPYLTFDSLYHFMENTIHSKKKTGCVTYKGEFYNPVMFHTSLEKELFMLEKEQGGKKVFLNHIEDAYLYELSSELETLDVDRMEDIKRLNNEIN